MTWEERTRSDTPSLLIDLESHEVRRMEALTLSAAGLRERDDLQRWVTEHPELIAPGLLLVTTTTHQCSTEEARQLLDHAPSLEDGALGSVRILLVAGSFGPAVTSVVLWLRDCEIDIGCVEVTARAVAGGRHAVLTARQILPLPEAEDYLVRRRRREQQQEVARRQPAEGSWESYGDRYPKDQVVVARALYDGITRYVDDHDLPWTPALRSWWLGYKRPGGHYVTTIGMRVEKPIEYAVKLPTHPEKLGLINPYPQLETRWDEAVRQWTWLTPSVDHVPDVAQAIDIARQYQPDKGSMKRI